MALNIKKKDVLRSFLLLLGLISAVGNWFLCFYIKALCVAKTLGVSAVEAWVYLWISQKRTFGVDNPLIYPHCARTQCTDCAHDLQGPLLFGWLTVKMDWR